MTSIAIQSINILGRAEELVADHQSALSAFRKLPLQADSVELSMTGFAGDMVQDTKHHGGNDKAICCYSSVHFDHWKKQLGFDLQAAAFGENLTLTGKESTEEHIYIGDRYQLGEAIVEVSEPRGPCYMIGIRYNYKPFPVLLQQSGYTGFYLRTIKPGTVRLADRLLHLSSHPAQISVMDVNRICYHEPKNREWLERLTQLEPLTQEWRERFRKLLAKA